jgi:hypothetical protein
MMPRILKCLWRIYEEKVFFLFCLINCLDGLNIDLFSYQELVSIVQKFKKQQDGSPVSSEPEYPESDSDEPNSEDEAESRR